MACLMVELTDVLLAVSLVVLMVAHSGVSTVDWTGRQLVDEMEAYLAAWRVA